MIFFFSFKGYGGFWPLGALWSSQLITINKQLARAESESASTGKVWGAAYHIPPSHAEEVHDYLDEREIDGYSVHYTPFYPFSEGSSKSAGDDSAPIICMVYIGQPTNPQFLRDPAQRDPQDVAQVISAGHGQSGKGTEYLYLLEKALEGLGLGTADVHVTDLVRRVKAIEAVGEGEQKEKEAEKSVKQSLATAEMVAQGDNIE
jgi:cation transport regulator ChaC